MTEYYVKTDGNNALDGLSWANAWATIDHAQSTILAGDTVHIREGEYPETAGFIFNPPASTHWEAEFSTHKPTLFSAASYDNTSVVTNNNIVMQYCIIGKSMGFYIDLNCTGFELRECPLDCWMGGSPTDLQFVNSTDVKSGVTAVVDFANCTNGYLYLFGWLPSAGGYFTIRGTGNIFEAVYFAEVSANFYCGDVSIDNIIIESADCLEIWGSSGNTFENYQFQHANGSVHIIKDASADGQQVFSGVKAPEEGHYLKRCTVDSAASLTLVETDRAFYETSTDLRTTVTTSNTSITITGPATNTTITRRPFLITTNADISALITEWELSDNQNKTWTVEATGSRTITFQLGDMLPDTKYVLKADGVKVSDATSNAAGIITFPAYTGSFSTKTFATGTPHYTTVPLVKKRIEHIDASLTDGDIRQYIDEVDSILNCIMKDSLLPNFDTIKHAILQSCATDLVALSCIRYNTAEFPSSETAETTANMLHNNIEAQFYLLNDPRTVQYLKSL